MLHRPSAGCDRTVSVCHETLPVVGWGGGGGGPTPRVSGDMADVTGLTPSVVSTGEYDCNLGEEEYEAAMSGGVVNEK